MSPVTGKVLSAGLVLLVLAAAAPCRAATLWTESVNGDLSNDQAAPRAFTLTAGVNSIIGTVGGADQQDWVALTIPAGFRLTSIVLGAYQSNDSQGFTGLQSGSSFVGTPFSASSYLGYVHFGASALNGALPPANLVGADLLPLMGNTTLAAGAAGFTPPLPAGTYTFLIQQLGSSTNYRFDYTITAVPAPSCMALLALAAYPRRSRRAR